MERIQHNSLVSIVVITYNSAKYVLETLESTKKQTYKNIELIITDDCSTDDTVQICRDWLDKNGKYFIDAKLIASPVNTGIPANANRGYKAAQGEWIKGIAGDDILLPNCVESLLRASKKCDILVGISQSFKIVDGKRILGAQYPSEDNYAFFNDSAMKQHKRLLVNSFNFAPGSFISKNVFLKLGGYDEHFRYLEDLPFWLKCTSNGYKLSLLKEPVVLYRTGHDSMVFQTQKVYNIAFYECLFSFRKKIIYKQVPWYNIMFWEKEILERFVFYFVVHICKNRNTNLTRSVMKISNYLYFQLYFYWVKKHLS